MDIGLIITSNFSLICNSSATDAIVCFGSHLACTSCPMPSNTMLAQLLQRRTNSNQKKYKWLWDMFKSSDLFRRLDSLPETCRLVSWSFSEINSFICANPKHSEASPYLDPQLGTRCQCLSATCRNHLLSVIS